MIGAGRRGGWRRQSGRDGIRLTWLPENLKSRRGLCARDEEIRDVQTTAPVEQKFINKYTPWREKYMRNILVLLSVTILYTNAIITIPLSEKAKPIDGHTCTQQYYSKSMVHNVLQVYRGKQRHQPTFNIKSARRRARDRGPRAV